MACFKKQTLVITLLSLFIVIPSLASAQSYSLQEQINALMQQIAMLQAQLTQLQNQAGSGLKNGDRVRALVDLRGRIEPSTTAQVLALIPVGSTGTIECDSSLCGVVAGGYTWWRIHWDNVYTNNNVNLESWSAGGSSEADYLTKLGGATPPPPPPTSSIQVISPNGGETWTKGTTQAIKWRDNMPYPTCPTGEKCTPSVLKYYDLTLVPYPPCTGMICLAYLIAPYTIAKGVHGSSYDYGLYYNWSVGISEPSDRSAPDGPYTVQVCQTGTKKVCDSSDSYFKIISGTTTNNPPVINGIPAIPSDIKVGQSVSFSWSATDADGDDLSWSVSFGDNTGVATTCQSPTFQSKQNWDYAVSHAWTKVGTYTVNVTVSDCRGGSDARDFNIVVNDVTTAPSCHITFSPTSGPVGSNFIATWTSQNDADSRLEFTCVKSIGTGSIIGSIGAGTVITQGSIPTSLTKQIPVDAQTCEFTARNAAGQVAYCSASIAPTPTP